MSHFGARHKNRTENRIASSASRRKLCHKHSDEQVLRHYLLICSLFEYLGSNPRHKIPLAKKMNSLFEKCHSFYFTAVYCIMEQLEMSLSFALTERTSKNRRLELLLMKKKKKILKREKCKL